MYKRLVAVLMSICMIIGTLTCLSGCGKSSRYFTFGQWLQLVNESFGMTSYTSDTPYFGNVGKNSEYFDAVQIATEWDVIDKNTSFDPKKTLKWSDALVTLVNVGGFMAESASDEEKIQFAINNFDSEIRDYWMKRSIPQEDAAILLTKAKQMWLTKTHDKSVEEYELKENVFDISDSDKVSVEEDGTIVFEDFTDTDAVKKDMIVLVPDGSDDPFGKEYVKVEKVETKDGNLIIHPSTEEVQLQDVYEELFLQSSLEPSLDDCVIYDGNGQLISVGENVQNMFSTGDYSATKLSGNKGVACANSSLEAKFKVDGIEVSVNGRKDDKGKLALSIGVKSDNLFSGDKNFTDKNKLQASAKFEVSNVSVTNDFDFSILKGLKSASLKVNYKIKETFALTYKHEATSVAAPDNNRNSSFLSNFKNAVMKDLVTGSGAKTIASKKEIKILSVNVYDAAIAKVCLDFKVKFTAEGSMELTITHNNCQGIEYKKGNIRLINENNKDVDYSFKAKAELTFNFGPALYVKGLKKCLVGVEVAAGIGAKAEITMHLSDEHYHLLESLDFAGVRPEDLSTMSVSGEMTMTEDEYEEIVRMKGGVYSAEGKNAVKLRTDTCLNASIYWILSVGVTDNSFLVSVVGNKVTLSWSILSDKNAVFANVHVDNWKFANAVVSLGAEAKKDHCTLEFTDFDKEEDKDDDQVDDASDSDSSESESLVAVGDVLALSTMTVTLQEGASESISVVTIPAGYTMSDIVFKSNDTSIATVDGNGTIKAKKAGSVIIYAETKDGKYSQLIAVLVLMPDNGGHL